MPLRCRRRLLAHALDYLRSHLLDLEEPHPNAGPAVAPKSPKSHEAAQRGSADPAAGLTAGHHARRQSTTPAS